GNGVRCLPDALDDPRPGAEDDVDVERDQLRDRGGDPRPLAPGSAALDYGVLPRDPTQLAQTLQERIVERIGADGGTDPEDLPGPLPLSGKRRCEEHQTRASEERAPVHHSISSSARRSSDGGIVRPRALAVLRLITSSNLVGCSTGRSPGLAPLRILSTIPAARRQRSGSQP